MYLLHILLTSNHSVKHKVYICLSLGSHKLQKNTPVFFHRNLAMQVVSVLFALNIGSTFTNFNKNVQNFPNKASNQ